MYNQRYVVTLTQDERRSTEEALFPLTVSFTAFALDRLALVGGLRNAVTLTFTRALNNIPAHAR